MIRPQVRAYINKLIIGPIEPYAISSVEGNMFLSLTLTPKVERKFGKMSMEEYQYASKRMWTFQPYTNWSGD